MVQLQCLSFAGLQDGDEELSSQEVKDMAAAASLSQAVAADRQSVNSQQIQGQLPAPDLISAAKHTSGTLAGASGLLQSPAPDPAPLTTSDPTHGDLGSPLPHMRCMQTFAPVS